MHPILLVGAALVGLPIVLHLIMKQEPKRLPFPAFRFLKQRLKTNQRKLRLRHFVLLALRMLLIALFCLALYQPTLLSEGLNISGSQPIAAVLVIDTSPGMGYADGDKTHLEEACRRATELVNDLPDGSRVAVVETGDPGGDWLQSTSDARSRIADIAKRAPKPGQPPTAAGGSQSVTSALVHAYQLLRTVDEQTDAADALPRLVAVFTDRAASSWDPSRVEDLKKLRDGIPDPKPAHAVIDVGTDAPVNVALLSAEMAEGRPQVVPANQPVSVAVTVAATGLTTKATVAAHLADKKELKEVEVPDGQTRVLTFEFRDLPPGLHQVWFELVAKDALMADNTRFFTFRVAEARKVLTITDDLGEPGVRAGDADFWALAAGAKLEFTVDVKKPADVTDAMLPGYEVVTLLNVARPDADLWGKLLKYVEAGGKLVVVPPGDDRMSLDAYNTGEAATKLLPGAFKSVVDTTKAFAEPKDAKAKDRYRGVVWSAFADADDRALQHPMLAPIKGWKQKGNVDAVKSPRRATRYWDVERRGDGAVVVTYDDADDPAKRHPAVLERTVLDTKDKTPKGKVLLLTTRLDTYEDWNDYWDLQNSWAVAFPELLLRYAAGATAEANFNHPCGQTVTIPLTKLLAGKRDHLILEGPGIVTSDAIVRPTERQTELRLGPPRTNTPGNFTLKPPVENPPWVEGFSLNVPVDESTLAKVPAEGVEELTGPGSVVPVGKNVSLEELLTGVGVIKHPVDLFPWLLIAVLMLLVVEGLVANRFYRRPRPS
jgi:hypothetical protein